MGKQQKPQLPKPTKSASDLQAGAGHVEELAAEGAQMLAARRPGEALVSLAKAWELDPQNVAVAINLGGAYILQGKHDRAVPVLEAAALLEPDNAMIWSNLAAAYLGKLPFSTRERQDRAIEAYERALALDARAPNVHYNLGLIYLERDDMSRAVAHFYDALETDPNDGDAQHYLDKIRRRKVDDLPATVGPGDSLPE